jgi:hypothetical protein
MASQHEAWFMGEVVDAHRRAHLGQGRCRLTAQARSALGWLMGRRGTTGALPGVRGHWANLEGNWAMIPSLNMSAISRISAWTRS